MPDIARTVFLPENWDQSVSETDNEVDASVDESICTAAEGEPSLTENAVTLPPETLVEIAVLNDEELLEQRKASVSAEICDLEKRVAQMEHSVEELSSEVKSIEEEIGKLQEQLDGKSNELRNIQASLGTAKRNYVLKTQEFSALEDQEKTISARQLFDAFLASGKSMEEILYFLHGKANVIEPLEGSSSPEHSVEDDADNSAVNDSQECSQPASNQHQAVAENLQEKQGKAHGRRSAFILPQDLEEEFKVLWEKIESMQGQTFYTMRGLPFQYEVKGKQIFVDRKGKAITESSLRISFHQAKTGEATGPRALKTFGASYVWSIFKKFGIIVDEEQK